jgi:hypothetical protein
LPGVFYYIFFLYIFWFFYELTIISFLSCSFILSQMEPLAHRKMDFEEFCAAAISTHQLEAFDGWEQIASTAFEHFEQEGNRVISVEELARVWRELWLLEHLPSTRLFLNICAHR